MKRVYGNNIHMSEIIREPFASVIRRAMESQGETLETQILVKQLSDVFAGRHQGGILCAMSYFMSNIFSALRDEDLNSLRTTVFLNDSHN